MAKAVRVLPIMKRAPTLTTLASNVNMGGQSSFSFGSYSWYSQAIQSSYQRLSLYNDYDLMDEDGDVSRALDVIADEMVGTVELGASHNLLVEILDDDMPSSTSEILQTALRIWVDTIGIHTKMFDIARSTIKYGDCFFMRSHHNSKWVYVPPRKVLACVVDSQDGATPLAWNIKADGTEVFQRLLGGDAMQQVGGSGMASHQIAIAPNANIVRFTTRSDMSDKAPFGESLLRAAVTAFKQKRLIEDAIIIYRVQRAPERRVFYVDVGSAPLPVRAQILEQFKNEIKQRKVPRQNTRDADPTENGSYDKIYDPTSTNDDYVFGISADSRGSRVETLPGGANVGEVSDLDTWRRLLWRALKIPHSYMDDGSDTQGVYNDGKTGTAYIQELKFNMMVQRYQQHLNEVFDREFKLYLKENDITIDSDKFVVKLPTPQNFAAYRQQAVDTDLLNNYSSAEGIGHFSKRFAMERFMMMTRQEILDNERSLKEELGLDPDDESVPAHLLYNEEFRLVIQERTKKRLEAEFDVNEGDLDEMLGGGPDDGFGGDSDFDLGGGPGGGGGDFGGGMDGLGGDDLGGDMDADGELDGGGDDLGGDIGDEPLDDDPDAQKPPL